jgi:PadR family transcriptional regulator, regulatory protein PadR
MNKSVFQNYKVELRRGTQILIVLSQLHEREYGYSLLEKLMKLGVNIEGNTLYPLMRRLEKQEVLISEWDTTETRPRKYYYLSEEGKELYQKLLDEWEQTVKEVKSLSGR